MSQPLLLTYYDVVKSAMDFLAGNSTSAGQEDIRRSIHAAYREIGQTCKWSFLHKQGRIHLNALYSTGTVAYTHSTRALDLTTGTWPTWAADAVVRVGGEYVVNHVSSRESDSQLILDATLNPGADVAAGTSYTIYQQWYALPWDFYKLIAPWGENAWRMGQQLPWDDMLSLDRYRDESGDMRYFCVREVPDLMGTMGLYMHPPADAADTIDFIYQRHPRQLRYTGHDTAETQGTITVTAASAAVVGSGTAFASKMVGAALRVGTDATYTPTGLDGVHPFDDERIVKSVTDTTHLTLDTTITTSRSGVKYCISDPVDVDSVLYDAFRRCVEKHLAIGRNLKNKGEVMASYRDALNLARGADQRVNQRRVMGYGMGYVYRFGDAPAAADVD